VAAAVAALMIVAATMAADARRHRHSQPAPQPVAPAGPAAAIAAVPPPEPAPPPRAEAGKAGAVAITFDVQNVQAVLGKDVRSSTDEDMGRLVDVVVDRAGQPRAAVIDFGGFLGVGSRKIAVDWTALNFARGAAKGIITVEFTRDQVKAAPEFKEGSPVVVLGALGGQQAQQPPPQSPPQSQDK
jgi:hypothetical protein